MNLFKKIFKVLIFLFTCKGLLLAGEVYKIGIWDNFNSTTKPVAFSYVDKNAPKGGVLRVGAIGSFDNFNPFAKRGISAGYSAYTYETLGEADDGSGLVMNSLLAKSFEVADDFSFVIINIDEKAKFSDGSKITSKDIKYSYDALINEATPRYKSYYSHIKDVEVLSPLKIKFTFDENDNKELPLIITQFPVLSAKWGEGKNLGEPQNTPILGSGPYKLKDYKMGTYIIYERDKNWWGKDLEINQGLYNFDEIRIDYYRDQTVLREALFAGEIDFYAETTVKDWVNSYNTPPVNDGRIIKEEVALNRPFGLRGFVYNIRKPLFKDKNVREALSLLFDFEWTNKALFYDKYTRYDSYYTNSPFVAPKNPSKEELEVLNLYKGRLNPDVFGAIPDIPKTDGSGNIREQLRSALNILKKSNWRLEKGKLLNKNSEQMKFSILINSNSFLRVVEPFKKNLEQLGVLVDIQMVDQTQYVNRIRSFDYDMILGYMPQSESPGNEQRYYFASSSLNSEGTRNYIGVNSEVIDELIDRLIVSKTYDELIINTRVLDRVLRHEYYVIFGWYSKNLMISYWKDRITPPHSHPRSGVNISSWYSTALKKK
ncbi:MAG: extracellular solute-binding protein [Campylobacteraceae bacterium]